MNLIRSALAGLFVLLAAATASAQQFPTVPAHSVIGRLGIPGDSGPSQAISFDVLKAQLGTANIPSVTVESKGGGCTANDNTQAVLDAVNSVPDGVRVLFPNNCTYHFRQTNTLIFNKKGVYLEGASRESTILQYHPTGDGSFLQWYDGVKVVFGGGLSKVSLLSDDTSFTKVMVNWYDTSTFFVSGVYCAGGTVTNILHLTGGAGHSQCLYTHGRDTTIISDVVFVAQIPIHIGLNPHAIQSADHYRFNNVMLIGGLTAPADPVIVVDPGVVFSNTIFDGMQTWNGGSDGFGYVDTGAVNLVTAVTAAGAGYTAGVAFSTTGGTCSTPVQIMPLSVNGSGGILSAAIAVPGVCSVVPTSVAAVSGGATLNVTVAAGNNLSFANVRSEQGANIASKTFNIQPAGQLRELSITNSLMDPQRCGALLKNVFFATFSQTSFAGGLGCNTAVDATAANGNDMLHYSGNYWLPVVTHNIIGLTAVRFDNSPTGTSTAVPPSALYSSTVTGSGFANVGVNNALVQAGSNGSVNLTVPAAVASNLVNVWGSVAGTISTSGTSPIVANATTGAMSCPTCGVTGSSLAQFAATTSAQLASTISDEVGSGKLLFNSIALNNVQNVDTTTQANVAFTGLSAAAAVADADTFPVNQGAGNLKQTFAAIKTWIKSWIAKADVGLGSVPNVDMTNLSNATSGTVAAARMPALTGGCTTSAGAVATTCTTKSNFPLGINVGTLTGGSTVYGGISTSASYSTFESVAQYPISAPMTLQTFYVAASGAPGGIQTYTMTVRKNGASAGITCTITGAATSCNDLTHTASFVAGDLIALQIVSSATAASVNTINSMSTAVTTSP